MSDEPNGFKHFSTPNPDPTVLTTQQLQREIALTRELVEIKALAIREVLECQQRGLEARLSLMETHFEKVLDRAAHEIFQLQNLQDEKLKGVHLQFSERDKRFDLGAQDNKSAIAAALSAQKEAASKSEVAFTKQIEQIQTILDTVTRSMNDKIIDLKARMDTGAGKEGGISAQWAGMAAAAGIAISLGSLVVLIMSRYALPH